MAINAKSIFLGCKYATKQMPVQEPLKDAEGTEKFRGWIVNTASVQGLVPYYGTPSYCASKGAAVLLRSKLLLIMPETGYIVTRYVQAFSRLP